jgi:pimeloyl-ACP methyl ester carboxylesterase
VIHLPTHKRRRLKRLAMFAAVGLVVFLFVLVPVGLSFLITNTHMRFPERGPANPDSLGLVVENVEFRTDDGVSLRGWWSAGLDEKAVIIFVHGLNRSRLEHLERAAESRKRGYGVLLFDLRDHGESDNAYTTLGVAESHDVCAAREFVTGKAGVRPTVLWGVSLGASTSLLAERQCPGSAAIVSDSSFLSFSETIQHHFHLIFRIPSFPIANLVVALTAWRMGFRAEDGDVEAAVAELRDVPILFVAGGADARMPPELARRLAAHAPNPANQVLVVDGAGHGQAFSKDRETYVRTAFEFLERVMKTKE